MSRQIPVEGSDKPAIVDDENFEYLSQFEWFAVEDADGKIHAGRIVLMEEDVLNRAANNS